jgi:hypothetical protein
MRSRTDKPTVETINRRAMLGFGATALAGTWLSGLSPALAKGKPIHSNTTEDDADTFVFSRLKFRTLNGTQDPWDCGIDKEEDFLAFLRENTNLKVSNKSFYERAISIEDLRKVYRHPNDESIVFSRPFIFMTGSGQFEFNEPEAVAISEYLMRGGFWYVDDCIANGERSDFYRCFLKEFRKVSPKLEMQPVPHDHAIYHCVYDMPNGTPYVQGDRLPDMGMFIEDRLAVFLTAVDLHCGWRWEFTNRTTHSDKTICRKMGVNIVIYALTH